MLWIAKREGRRGMRKVVTKSTVPPPSSSEPPFLYNTRIPFPEFPRVAIVCLARTALPALSTLRTPEGESDAKGPFVESREC